METTIIGYIGFRVDSGPALQRVCSCSARSAAVCFYHILP